MALPWYCASSRPTQFPLPNPPGAGPPAPRGFAAWRNPRAPRTLSKSKEIDEDTYLKKPLEQQVEELSTALVLICVKCRSNEWGPLTTHKEILNWFHDTASKALKATDE